MSKSSHITNIINSGHGKNILALETILCKSLLLPIGKKIGADFMRKQKGCSVRYGYVLFLKMIEFP